MLRYLRQIEVIGVENQKKLSNSSVLVIGAGGLGSAVITYLACAGVGKIGVSDGDLVEIHNLDRQFIHAGKIGIKKSKSAEMFIKTLNPEVEIEIYDDFGKDKSLRISKYDLVVCCVDTIEDRHKINEVCFKNKKPMIHAAISGFEGELAVFDFRNSGSPCYECIYPRNIHSEKNSVVSPIAGIVGSMQALEAIKLICNFETLNHLLRMDFRYMEFLKISISKRKDCPVCSKNL